MTQLATSLPGRSRQARKRDDTPVRNWYPNKVQPRRSNVSEILLRLKEEHIGNVKPYAGKEAEKGNGLRTINVA
jgi:hypothetical protein